MRRSKWPIAMAISAHRKAWRMRSPWYRACRRSRDDEPTWTAGKAGELKISATLTTRGLAPFGMRTCRPSGWAPTASSAPSMAMLFAHGNRPIGLKSAALNRAVEGSEVQQQMKAIYPAWIDPHSREMI